MADEIRIHNPQEEPDAVLDEMDGEYDVVEPLSVEEGDEILAAIGALIERTSNDSVQEILESACFEIAQLVASDEESDEVADDADDVADGSGDQAAAA